MEHHQLAGVVSALFPDILNAKPYRVQLYSRDSGWDGDEHTMIVDEAHGICKIEHDTYKVHNSHGTDVDYDLYYSDDLSMDKMAGILESKYGAAAIQKAGPFEKDNYNPGSDAYIERLRASGRVFDSVRTAAEELMRCFAPQWKVDKLLYSASLCVVLLVENSAGLTSTVKLTRVPTERKAELDKIYERIIEIEREGNEDLLPIQEKIWIPLDDTSYILAIWMPVLEKPGIKKGYSGMQYAYTVEETNKDTAGDEYIRRAIGLAGALKALHENGLVHLDIKPENLFYHKDEDGVISWYLGDFDTAKPVNRQYEGALSFTKTYAAPEIVEKKPFSYSCDVYSWGRTMFFLAFGDIPDDESPAKIDVNGMTIDLGYKRHSCRMHGDLQKAQYYKILSRAMDPDPFRRFSSGKELLEALEAVSESDDVSVKTTEETKKDSPTEACPDKKTSDTSTTRETPAKEEVNATGKDAVNGRKGSVDGLHPAQAELFPAMGPSEEFREEAEPCTDNSAGEVWHASKARLMENENSGIHSKRHSETGKKTDFVRVLYPVRWLFFILALIFAFRGITLLAHRVQVTHEEPISYVTFQDTMEADIYVKTRVTDCQNILQTSKTESSNIKSGKTQATLESEYLYLYAFCTDEDGREIILLFENNERVQTWESRERAEAFRKETEEYLSALLSSGEDVYGITARVDGSDRPSLKNPLDYDFDPSIDAQEAYDQILDVYVNRKLGQVLIEN